MKINGKWKFNSVDVSGTDYMLFDFISNNQRFIGVDTNGLLFITHLDELGIPCGVNFVDDDYNLVSEYSTISIIGEAEVDENLIIAFRMEKISDVDTIPMEHPKGIKLLTKGHKLSKDLEVVPTFMETVDVNIVNNGRNYLITYTAVENGGVVSKEISYDYTNSISSIKNVVVNSVIIATLNDSYNQTVTVNGLEVLVNMADGIQGVVALYVPNKNNLSFGIDI